MIPHDMQVGSVHKSKNFGELTIVKYTGKYDVDVEFLETKCRIKTYSSNIRAGSVKDPMQPTVYGVGFIGVGNYTPTENNIHTKAYKQWGSMLERCYSERWHKKKPTYIGCTVDKYWHNFQNFAKWHEENYPNDGGSYQLDKDIKVKGNKVYSERTCTLVTNEENAAFSFSKEYKFRSPKGEVVKIVNLAKFCRENNLNNSNMLSVLSGRYKHSQGWTLP